MEPYELHKLTDLLNYPYLVRNRLAEALYGEVNVAAYTRLMSRASGRHRCREEEVKGVAPPVPLPGQQTGAARRKAAETEPIANHADKHLAPARTTGTEPQTVD